MKKHLIITLFFIITVQSLGFKSGIYRTKLDVPKPMLRGEKTFELKIFKNKKKAYIEIIEFSDSGNMLYGYNGYYLVNLEKENKKYIGKNELAEILIEEINNNELELTISKNKVYLLSNIFTRNHPLIVDGKEEKVKVKYEQSITEQDEELAIKSADLFKEIVITNPLGHGISWTTKIIEDGKRLF